MAIQSEKPQDIPFGNVVLDDTTCHEARPGEVLGNYAFRAFGGAGLELRTGGAADAFETDTGCRGTRRGTASTRA